jgi:predicted DNA-binding protein
MLTSNKQSKLIGVRISPQMYDLILDLAKKDGRTISNYVRKILIDKLDETEYLLSSPNNAKRLRDSIKQADEGKLKTFNNPSEILDHVQNFTDR